MAQRVSLPQPANKPQTLAKRRHVAFSKLRSPRWLKYAFVVVVIMIGAQVVSDSGGQGVSFNSLIANGPLGTIAHVLGATDQPSFNSSKINFINDTYNRCQNKLGVQMIEKSSGTAWSESEIDQVEAELKMIFNAGGRYAQLTIGRATDADVTNAATFIVLARDHTLMPILIIEGPDFADGPTIANFYIKIDDMINLPNQGNNLPREFIVASAPRDLFQRGYEIITAAEYVSEALSDRAGIIVGTPVITVTKEYSEYYDFGGALKLQDYYDTVLVSVRNDDTQFGIGPSATSLRGYGLFQVIHDWLASHQEAESEYIRAIVVSYGATDWLASWKQETNNRNATSKLVDRFYYDLGLFQDDPYVDGVVFDATTQYFLDQDDLAYINRSGTNCPYDTTSASTYEYSENETARVCGTATEVDSEERPRAYVVCNADGVCGGTLSFTRQVGLPIRSFGSNSAAGTDSQQYMPIAARVASTVDLPGYDFLNQFAAPLKGSDGSSYVMPWLGSAINNAGEVLKAQMYGADTAWQLNQAIDEGASVSQARSERAAALTASQSVEAYIGESAQILGLDTTAGFQSLENERVVCKGKVCVNKSYVDIIDGWREFRPEEEANEKKVVNQCNGRVTAVANDPQNMIYGEEQVIDSATVDWQGTSAELCYATMTGVVKGSLQCNVSSTSACRCANGYFATRYGITSGSCTLTKDQVNACIQYQGGANSYPEAVQSGVYVEGDYPQTPEYDIEGVYKSLASLYVVVQEMMARRGQKLVFAENSGWESDIVTRAYATDPTGSRWIEKPRQANGVNSTSGSQYSLVPADGGNVKIEHQYYEKLAYIDELVKVWDTLALQSILPGGELEYSDTVLSPVVTDAIAAQTDFNEGQSGEFTCGDSIKLRANESVNWAQVSDYIYDFYIKQYNFDSNSSYSWVGGSGMAPYPGLSTEDAAMRTRVTENIMNYATDRGLNAKLVLALWLEESGASAVGQRNMGCLGYVGPGGTPAEITAGLSESEMISRLQEQVRCIESYVNWADSQPNPTQAFMCRFSGEKGWDTSASCSTFTNNPNFPRRICDVYSRLTTGSTAGLSTVASLGAVPANASSVLAEETVSSGRHVTVTTSLAEAFAGWMSCDHPIAVALREQGGSVNCLAPYVGDVTNANYIPDPLGIFLCKKGFDVGEICDLYYPDVDTTMCEDGNIRLVHPLHNDTARITQGYGGAHAHNGVDYRAPVGTPVYAAAAGTVVEVVGSRTGNTCAEGDLDCAAGNYVKIEHIFGGRTYWTEYQHLEKVLVSAGQVVGTSTQIGTSGNTGRSSGPHLHFELRKVDCYDGYHEGKPLGTCTLDPTDYLVSTTAAGACTGGGGTGEVPAGCNLTEAISCPVQGGGTYLYQSSSGPGSHTLASIKGQLATDIGVRDPNSASVISVVSGKVVEVRSPLDTACIYIDSSLSGCSASSGIAAKGFCNGIKRSNGDLYYDGGFVIHILGDDGNLYRYAHVENVVVGVGQRVEAGQKIAQVYDTQLDGDWADYSAKAGDGGGCFDIAHPHLHFAIIDAAGQANSSGDWYTGNQMDSTACISSACGF